MKNSPAKMLSVVCNYVDREGMMGMPVMMNMAMAIVSMIGVAMKITNDISFQRAAWKNGISYRCAPQKNNGRFAIRSDN